MPWIAVGRRGVQSTRRDPAAPFRLVRAQRTSARRPPGFVERDRGISPAGCDDGAKVGETGRRCRSTATCTTSRARSMPSEATWMRGPGVGSALRQRRIPPRSRCPDEPLKTRHAPRSSLPLRSDRSVPGSSARPRFSSMAGITIWQAAARQCVEPSDERAISAADRLPWQRTGGGNIARRQVRRLSVGS